MGNHANNHSLIAWVRYWCTREAKVYIDEHGFLVKSDNADKDYDNPHAKPLADFLATPCLVLLGPPGMGKTTEVKAAHDADTGSKLLVNLGDVTSDSDLRARLSGSPTIQEWQKSKPDAPTLWLDSLDEALADVSNIVKALKARLSELKGLLTGLRLRIACRVADWLPSLERELQGLWANESIETVELLPLRSEDVNAAAQNWGVDTKTFMTAVSNANAGPFAAKPVTLFSFLLPIFHDEGALPASQVALYEAGCRHLAYEWADHRREQAQSANDDAERRFQAAQRVAAAMTFYGRDRLDCTNRNGKTAYGTVFSREIGTASPGSGDEPGAPTIESVEEVAHTALMSGDAAHHIYRFSHRTFQEFLAALFLHGQMTLSTSPMPLPKVLTLFLSPQGDDKRVVPQLMETAAWLAALNEKFRAALLEADSVAVLHSDVARQDEATQRKLFAALRDGLGKREISTRDLRRQSLRGMKFAGIADELRRILSDTSLPEDLYRFAIDVADSNEIGEVYGLLAELALDTTRPAVVRRLSAHAIAHGPDIPEVFANAKKRLEPLLHTTAAEDPDDDLRGNALRALWRTLEPAKLFDLLTPPHNDSYSGAYWFFVHTLSRELESKHLPAGLAWAAVQPRFHDMSFEFRRLMQRVFNLAWMHLDSPAVLDALANALAARVAHHESVHLDNDGEDDYDPYNRRPTDKPSELTTDDPDILQKRRRLCQAVVAGMALRPQNAGQTAAFAIAYYLQLAQPADFDWLLQQHLSDKDAAKRALWLDLAASHWGAWRGSPEQVGIVRVLETQDEAIREAFRVPIALLDPNSPESLAQREGWERHERELQAIMDRQDADRKRIDPPPAQQVVDLLDAFEKGNTVAFWHALQWMKADEYGRRHYGVLSFDPRDSIGWKEATPGTRERLIAAVASYLESAQESPDEWVGTDKLHWPSTAGLSALILLYHEQPDTFNRVSREAWARWPNIVLEHGHIGEHKTGEALVIAGYAKAPIAFLKAMEDLFRRQAKSERSSSGLWFADSVWNVAISNVVFKVILEVWPQQPDDAVGSAAPRESTNSGGSHFALEQALTLLLRHEHRPAREWCMTRLADSKTQVPVMTALLNNAPTRDEWALIWPALIRDDEQAKRILGRDLDFARSGSFLGGLDESQLAELYLWLLPRSLAEPPEGSHSVGEPEKLMEVRNAAVNALVARGTNTAVAQLERIGEQISDPWFHTLIIEARANVRRSGYVPVKPRALWRLIAEAKSRLVRGERELLEVVVEALERINHRLQQRDNPRVSEVWDCDRPKPEKDLSAWLADQLAREIRESGVVIGREIEIGLPGVKGDQGQTDLQVIAKSKDGGDPFGVIIEIKGCWHREVQSAMATQLRDRYLKNHSFTHGV